MTTHEKRLNLRGQIACACYTYSKGAPTPLSHGASFLAADLFLAEAEAQGALIDPPEPEPDPMPSAEFMGRLENIVGRQAVIMEQQLEMGRARRDAEDAE